MKAVNLLNSEDKLSRAAYDVLDNNIPIDEAAKKHNVNKTELNCYVCLLEEYDEWERNKCSG